MTHSDEVNVDRSIGRAEATKLGFHAGSDGELFVLARAAGVELPIDCHNADWTEPSPGAVAGLYGAVRGLKFKVVSL